MNEQRSVETKEWYDRYYAAKGADRNDSRNPEVLFQELAFHAAFARSFRAIDRRAKILDVGGGGGAGCLRLISSGFDPANLTNIDILPDRVALSQRNLPSDCTSICGDASNMATLNDGSFDVVMSMTMFIQLLDEELAGAIANEMIRVCRPGGKIIIFDWRYDFWRERYRAVDGRRLKALFGIGSQTALDTARNGPLIPPIGRFLSKRVPFLYFLVALIPGLAGLKAYTLVKK
jgi:SAM-dependent methyltransferase